MKFAILAIVLLASCTHPLQVITQDAGAERPCSILIADDIEDCVACNILKSAADVDILAVYVDDVRLWSASWEIDENSCLVLKDCDGKLHEVMAEVACLPPRH